MASKVEKVRDLPFSIKPSVYDYAYFLWLKIPSVYDLKIPSVYDFR